MEVVIYILLMVSFVFCALSFVGLVFYNSTEVIRKIFGNRILCFSCALIAAVWCARLAVGIYNMPKTNFTLFEEIFNSLIHALQTFSMDEDYTKYIEDGRAMILSFGAKQLVADIYGIYVSVLNVIAPVAGGAILFDILNSLFPKVRLFFESLFFWKPIYYFSELNERSLILAKSILNVKNDVCTRPIIVFTDVYVDQEEEVSSEQFIEAKQIGAICLSTDLTHINLRKFGERRFFLIDENEISNLRTLTVLSDKSHCMFLSGAKIYLFSQNDIHVLVEEGVRTQLRTNIDVEQLMPEIKPIKGYRNLVFNLLYSMPLYEPIINRQDSAKELNITIFGTGHIGTEMFLSTYWCGQILDYQLAINMVSKEQKELFAERINNINPDILDSSVMEGEDSKGKNILKMYPNKEEYAPAYFKYRYYEMDVYKNDLSKTMEEESAIDKFKLADSDYIVIAFGSDEENLAFANMIRQSISIAHLNEPEKRTVIAYVVYNDKLRELLNKENENKKDILHKIGIEMYAFGSLEEVYSYNNIFMEELNVSAEIIGNTYDAIVKQSSKEKLKNREENEYKYWSNIARALHIKYKIFSSGLIKSSVFDNINMEETMNWALQEYRHMVQKPSDEKEREKTDHLAWLEHRRWNAFMRSKGFRCPTQEQLEKYSATTGDYRSLSMKFHPCLVECDKKGIRDRVLPGKEAEGIEYDMLDYVTLFVRKHNMSEDDFKKFDYPDDDFKIEN